MAYYSKKRRRRSGGAIIDLIQGIGYILVAFLLIGFLGSLFREALIDPDLDATKPPVTDVTEPEVTLLSFIVRGDTFYYEEGMTWQEFIDSDYSQNRFNFDEGHIRFQCLAGDDSTWFVINDDPSAVVVLPTDVIDPDDVATWC